VFEVALMIHKAPDEVRQMPIRDIRWLKIVSQAQDLAAEHLAKREQWRNKSKAKR
jgi:hypothetical protein